VKLLVTGAGGFIGTHLCRLLLAQGHEVVALLRPQRVWPGEGEGSGFRVETCDVLDQERLAALCARAQVECIYHLAVQPPEEPQREAQVNTLGTLSALQAGCQAGVRRLVFTSSMSVYNFLAPACLPVDEDHPLAPQQEYGAEKELAEEYCRTRATGMEVLVLRLAGVYGPGKRRGAVYQFLRAALDGQPIAIPVDRGVDLLYVEDAVQALAAAAQRGVGRQVLNIGSGGALPLSQVAALACRQAGNSVPISCGPSGAAFCLDISRARAALGFAPRTLGEGMACFFPWICRETR
jgi:UDP-glucose 4-epimerase